MNPILEKLLERFKEIPNECIVERLQMAFEFISKYENQFEAEDIKNFTDCLWHEAEFKCRRDKSINLYEQANGDWDKNVYEQAKSIMHSIEDKYHQATNLMENVTEEELPRNVGFTFNDSITKCKIILSSMDVDRSDDSWQIKIRDFLEALEKVDDPKGYLLLIWCFRHLLSTCQFFSIDEYVQTRFKYKK